MADRAFRLVPLILLAAALAAIAAGCGGGSGGSDSTAAFASSKFGQQVESICARGRLRALRYQPSRRAGRTELEAAADLIKTDVIPSLQTMIGEIEALDAPTEDQEPLEALLAAMQRSVDTAKKAGEPTLDQIDRLLGQSGHLAKQDGLTACILG